MKIIYLALFLAIATLSECGIIYPIISCIDRPPREFRIQNCEGSGNCVITSNTDTLMEVDFTASENIPVASLLIEALIGDTRIPIIDAQLGTLAGGLSYTASQTIRGNSGTEGRTGSIILQIYHDSDSRKFEVCVFAAVQFNAN